MNITRRILLHLAAGAGLVIAVATTVTYAIVYSAAKERDLKHLRTYVAERSRREEVGFQHVQANLTLVRGQFLKRMEGPIPRDCQAKWDERFRLFPDGAWRSREQFSDGRKWSTLWANRQSVLTPEWQIQILRAQDICNELLPGWVDTFPSCYFVLSGPCNIGFDPRIPSWVWDTAADYNPTNLEWFQLALPPEKPPDAFSWTGVIEEPTTKVPIVSVYLPIERNGVFLGSVGHDIYVNRMMEETTRSEFPGAMHVIFRQDGRLIAHPTQRKAILASRGLLRMQDSGDPGLASLYRAVSSQRESRYSGFDPTSDSYFSVGRLVGPGWYFLTTLPRIQLQRQAFASAQWVLWSGSVSLALVMAFLAATLRRQIAVPLAELTRATRQMSSGDNSARAAVGRDDELGALSASFNEMAGRVACRDAELRHLNQDLEQRVALRTSELTTANLSLEQARGEALRLLARERELNELKSDFVSMVSHEFRTPLEIIMSSVDNLQRYRERLPAEKREQLLQTIHKAVRRMTGMMEEVLVLGRVESGRMEFKPVRFDLPAFCRRVADEIHSATGGRCPIDLQLNDIPSTANGDESVLRHVLSNLLSNAVKYSPEGQTVILSVSQKVEEVIFQVKDRGCGIPAGDQERLFQAFHRGSNVRQVPGTGLGLVIVQRCVDLHGGRIRCESAEGQGTTFVVSLPLLRKSEAKYSQSFQTELERASDQ